MSCRTTRLESVEYRQEFRSIGTMGVVGIHLGISDDPVCANHTACGHWQHPGRIGVEGWQVVLEALAAASAIAPVVGRRIKINGERGDSIDSCGRTPPAPFWWYLLRLDLETHPAQYLRSIAGWRGHNSTVVLPA